MPIDTVSHTLLVLGFDRAMVMVRNLPTIEAKSHEANMPGLLATFTLALHAAELAGSWAPGRNERFIEQLRIAAMMQFLGDIAVWSSNTPRAADFFACLNGDGHTNARTERRRFGSDLAALGYTLAKHAGLGGCVLESLEGSGPLHPQWASSVLAARLARTSNTVGTVKSPTSICTGWPNS